MFVKDRKGRNWDVSLTTASARRVEAWDFSLLGVSKIAVFNYNENFIADLLTGDDPQVLMAIAYVLCKPEIDDVFRDIPDENNEYGENKRELAFLESFDGEAINRVRNAIVEEYSNFFPRKKSYILGLVEEQKEADKKLFTVYQTKLKKTMDKAFKEAEKQMDKIMEKEIGNISYSESSQG